MNGFRVEPLTPERFEDFAAVLGPSGVGGCWCRYWMTATLAEWRAGTSGGASAPNREAFRGVVESGPPPGLLGYDGDSPVAWCRLTPRAALPGLQRSRHFATALDTEGVWSLSCFVVKRSHRGRGLTAVLAAAAVDAVREAGGWTVEAYPWDVDERRPSATVYTGLATTFRRLGFETVQRTVPHRPMMRLEVRPRR